MPSYKNTDKIMQKLADYISHYLEDYGFALLVFDIENHGAGNYVSNCKRTDMIEALRETADRLEKNEDIPVTTANA